MVLTHQCQNLFHHVTHTSPNTPPRSTDPLYHDIPEFYSRVNTNMKEFERMMWSVATTYLSDDPAHLELPALAFYGTLICMHVPSSSKKTRMHGFDCPLF
jgi:hypothetical protein